MTLNASLLKYSSELDSRVFNVGNNNGKRNIFRSYDGNEKSQSVSTNFLFCMGATYITSNASRKLAYCTVEL